MLDLDKLGKKLDDALSKETTESLNQYLSKMSELKNRFTKPTGKQMIDIAIMFNDGKLEHEKLTDMVSYCQFVIDRLYDNGDVSLPSLAEIEINQE